MVKESVLDLYLPEKPREHCGVFALVDTEEAANLTFHALLALQHRGQESAGIAASNGQKIEIHKASGLVSAIFRTEDMNPLQGTRALGHVRYSTSKGTGVFHAQPVSLDPELVLAHNGNLPDTRKAENFAEERGIDTLNLNDSEIMYQVIRYFQKRGASLTESVADAYQYIEGAFAVVVMSKNETVAFQDRCAMKPLVLGKINGGYAFASETCALDTVNAKFIRELEPGEMVSVDSGSVSSHQLAKGELKRDSWEYVYFARPDSIMLGQNIYQVRNNFGRILAREYPIEADIIVPIPNSGSPAAIGYAAESGIPFHEAIIKNSYIGRTFIQPGQRLREAGVRAKLNVIKSLVEGKRVVAVDDSIVRGTTSPHIIAMLRAAGAKEVHMMLASCTYRYPDFYGTDTPDQNKLIAYRENLEGIRRVIGADSVNYLSFAGLKRGIGLPEDDLSYSWHTGIYPIPIDRMQKNILIPAA